MAGQTEAILTRILEGIDRGELAPSDPIEETALIAACGVSRTPLREANIRLEAMGLVVRPPRKGAMLFKPTLEEFLAILEVPTKLESQAARAARANPDRGRSSPPANPMHRRGATRIRSYQLNLRFHEAVALTCGNPLRVELIKTNARKLLAYCRARYRTAGAIAASARDHRASVELIRDRDADAAEGFMVGHVQFGQVTAMDLLAALGQGAKALARAFWNAFRNAFSSRFEAACLNPAPDGRNR